MRSARLRFQEGLNRFVARLAPKPVVIDLQPGRGEYGKAIEQASQEAKMTAIPGSGDDVLIPYRTVHGLWLSDRFVSKEKAETWTELNRFWDWLVPGGIAYLCMMEGEGHKLVTQAGRERKSTLITYYQPQELDELVTQAGYQVIDAWREHIHERPYIHAIIQRPE